MIRLARARKRIVAAAMIGVAGSAGVVALLDAPASADPPDVVAWWNAANVGNGAPAPPAPPDVSTDDVLVQGSNSAPTAPINGAPASSSAVAGFIYTIPAGATVSSLTLQIDGTAPPAAPTIVACKATRDFFAEDDGVWTDVPPYDAQTCDSSPVVSGTTLVYKNIGKLVSGTTLAILLLPGPVDRAVLKKPDANALQVTNATGFGAVAAPFGTGTNAGPVAPPGDVPVASSVGGGAVQLPSDTSTGTEAGVAPPVVAPSPNGASQANAAPAAAAAGTGGLTTTQRRVLAAVVIALELLGFLMLMGDREIERLPIAGGRLRPPDRGGQVPVGATAVAGIGRWRSERQGQAPRL